MALQEKIKSDLISKGADFVYFVDISQLPEEQRKGFPNAILIGIILSQELIEKITNTRDYVQKMIQDNQISNDEFHLKEQKTDRLADYISEYLSQKGYSAYSQSESNILLTGCYDTKNKSTPLPHKTIAGLAGLGWIGKNDLLVNTEFGCAFSMCSVLTNAPVDAIRSEPVKSLCGDCRICKDLCLMKAIKGNLWTEGIPRDKLIDVSKCNTCLVCLALCPWTQKYMNKKTEHITEQ